MTVINKIEQHLIQHWMYFKRTEHSTYIDNNVIKYLSVGPYNRVMFVDWSNTDRLDIEEQMDNIIKLSNPEGEPFLWIVGPSTQPAELKDLLHTRGFQHNQRWTGMALSPEDFKMASGHPEGFEFIKVETEEDLRKWVEVYIEGYQRPSESAEQVFHLFQPIATSKQNEYQLYLGLDQGEPAVCGAVYIEDGMIAGLYCIATHPMRRGKGLATSFLQNLVDLVIKQGASLCVLHATEAGKFLYEKIGFTSYGHFEVYKKMN
ncbi:GNAT family N-acetyltransferase [Ammoniphilus sp. CFH 90114]|uniref:GNAT family N-acetyltransferase n=1 Tax=Ammoniphilus sp. CFH 90114 TaxID=2493665 RepID=UPI0010100631|nr:GNAT family N-acetyltransferase [Ammoniphilus sp. CFH 90114]